MRCMSCQTETKDPKIFNEMFLCHQCHALAGSAEREITKYFDRAKLMAMNWLGQHILKGGLLTGGSGAAAAKNAGLKVDE
jgi:hypothetical protein